MGAAHGSATVPEQPGPEGAELARQPMPLVTHPERLLNPRVPRNLGEGCDPGAASRVTACLAPGYSQSTPPESFARASNSAPTDRPFPAQPRWRLVSRRGRSRQVCNRAGPSSIVSAGTGLAEVSSHYPVIRARAPLSHSVANVLKSARGLRREDAHAYVRLSRHSGGGG